VELAAFHLADRIAVDQLVVVSVGAQRLEPGDDPVAVKPALAGVPQTSLLLGQTSLKCIAPRVVAAPSGTLLPVSAPGALEELPQVAVVLDRSHLVADRAVVHVEPDQLVLLPDDQLDATEAVAVLLGEVG
jgi:hypothetical protein